MSSKPRIEDMMGDDEEIPAAPLALRDDVAPDDEESKTGTSLLTFSSETNFDASEIEIPKIKLLQAMSPDVQAGEAKMGQWSVFGMEPVDELIVVPISRKKSRTLWSDVEGEGAKCTSDDGVVGRGDPGGPCGPCPFAQWTPGNRKDGKNNPPKCTEAQEYICWVPAAQTLALLKLQKTAYQAGRIINSGAAMRGFGNFAVQLTATAKEGRNRSKFAVPVIRVVSANQPDLEDARQFISK